jgi:predicted transcriptional regulator
LAKALESLNLAMIERKGVKLQLLGKVHPADEETFDVIVKSGEALTAVVLKEKLGIKLTAVNERLSKLAGWSVIRRTTGTSKAGRQQHMYTVPR